MYLSQAIPLTCWLCRINYKTNNGGGGGGGGGYYFQREIGVSRVCLWSDSRKLKCAGTLAGRWRLTALDTRISHTASSIRAIFEIPVTCFQLIGVTEQAEKDEIVKSVLDLKNAEVEEGYSMDVVLSRLDLLMDVRDKLLFEPEYAGNVKEKIPPKSSIRLPWSWLPGALCLLQEVGEVKLVLEIGRVALQHPDAKPYVHDILLSLALAECTTAKISFEKNKVSQGFEALARAQSLLRSKDSLEELTLLSQIEESLEELAPACTLELLGITNSPENAERRRGAISALRELLRQGLDADSSCQVDDWQNFLALSLKKLTALEITDLLPWGDLAATRKNKKSLESQNQRVVIDCNSFYVVLLAHLAVGFSTKQRDLITKAKTICECLMSSDGSDLKLEESLCSFLLGQGNKTEVVEKLKIVESNSNNALRNTISGNRKEASDANQLLEAWLRDAVLNLFPDTKDCPPIFANFFNGEKRTPAIKRNARAPQTMSSVGHRSMTNTLFLGPRDTEDSISRINGLNRGTAVKQLAGTDMQGSLISDKSNNESSANTPSVQLKRNLGTHNSKVWENWLARAHVVRNFTSVAVLGCILFASFRLTRMNVNDMRSAANRIPHKSTEQSSSTAWQTDYSIDNNIVPAHIKGNGVSEGFKRIVAMVTMKFNNNGDAKSIEASWPSVSFSSAMRAVSRRLMPMEEAEALVKQWQETKAEALGPNHRVHILPEILDDSMLDQWHTLADAAKSKACYWKFVVLQLSVLRAEILSDGLGEELAEIEALLEEAAELVNETEQKNPSYYSTYKIRYVLRRQEDGSWRFCKGDLQKS